MHQVDREVAITQCVEAVRHYAAAHGGKLPSKLTDIPDLDLPLDPVTSLPFAYRLEGSQALLEAPPFGKDEPRPGFRYELTVAR